jgi:hypothetical protein
MLDSSHGILNRIITKNEKFEKFFAFQFPLNSIFPSLFNARFFTFTIHIPCLFLLYSSLSAYLVLLSFPRLINFPARLSRTIYFPRFLLQRFWRYFSGTGTWTNCWFRHKTGTDRNQMIRHRKVLIMTFLRPVLTGPFQSVQVLFRD